jgi:hypothetical protein
VADFTYVATWTGIVYHALVVDVLLRAIIGWSAATSKRGKLVLDAAHTASTDPGAVQRRRPHSEDSRPGGSLEACPPRRSAMSWTRPSASPLFTELLDGTPPASYAYILHPAQHCRQRERRNNQGVRTPAATRRPAPPSACAPAASAPRTNRSRSTSPTPLRAPASTSTRARSAPSTRRRRTHSHSWSTPAPAPA